MGQASGRSPVLGRKAPDKRPDVVLQPPWRRSGFRLRGSISTGAPWRSQVPRQGTVLHSCLDFAFQR